MTGAPGVPPGGWDDVIVGAGSAGAVLASRLSECPERRVLLLEAGTEQASGPSGPLGHSVLTGANWDFDAWLGAGAGQGRRFPYPVGKAVGGSSAVNGAIALRGLPADFDGWATAGNPGWAWDRVLPYFTRLEADADTPGPWHGQHGPVPIKRPASGDLDPVARAFLGACREAGLPDLPDMNGPPGAGVGLVPSNSRAGQRVSAAQAYLVPALARPNLTVRPGCRVTRVLTDGHRAVGVEASSGTGPPMHVRAGQVTLSAGAIGTPAILQRSGIAAAGRIQALGVPAIADLPGVGENLADHPVLAIWALPGPGVSQPGGPLHTVMARMASSDGDLDIGLFLAGNVTGTGVPVIGQVLAGRSAVSVSAALLAPASRGRVYLPDAAPGSKPVIVLRLATADTDVRRLMEATRMAWSLVRSSHLAGLLERVFVWTDRMVADDRLLAPAVRRFATPMWHPAGTARMGPATDPMAVVDERCRVHTMTGLRVVDASVMPSIPRATPNLTCMMLAERVAGWMA